jgi:di/tricarboxylate transporter
MMPDLPNFHAGAVLALTGVALVLFTRARLALETSSLLVLALLTVGFELVPFVDHGSQFESTELFHGFGHEALVAVCALMMVGQGLVRTGALEPVGRVLARMWAHSPALSALATLVVAAVLSAFVNNTPIVVLMLPILASVCLRTGRKVSGVLMPMGFATLVGGTGTTIGTSTNLLVVAVAADLGLKRFGMFDFIGPALVSGAVAIVYLWLIAPRLLPDRKTALDDQSPRLFSGQLHVGDDSACAGLTLLEARKLSDGLLSVKRILRDEGVAVMPLPDAKLRIGDRLLVEDTATNLTALERALGAALFRGDTRVDDDHPLTADEQQVAEIAIAQGSPLVGVTVRYVRFVDRYQVVVLALHRAGKVVASRDSDVAGATLREGDVLLVQGATEQIAKLKREGEFLVLDATTDLPRSEGAGRAMIITAVTIGAAATGLMPIAVSAVAGALAMIMARCLSWQEATRALSVPVILVVVASLALGSALLETGGTQYLTDVFLAVADGASAPVMLAGLMGLMAILTNVVSNNAAAVIGTPVGVGIATQLGVDPEPFVLAVLFGANMSYATPMAYKTNLLVMTAGGYRFMDFVRVGVPLILIMWVTLALLLPAQYDLAW